MNHRREESKEEGRREEVKGGEKRGEELSTMGHWLVCFLLISVCSTLSVSACPQKYVGLL